MKKKSNNPVIKSFEEFTKAVELVRKADGKGICGRQNTYQTKFSGYIHAQTMQDAYQYYLDNNLLFDPGEFKIGDVVANRQTKWIGTVIDVFDRGDVRTDADGVVFEKYLELYDPEKHKRYHIPESAKKEIQEKLSVNSQ